MSNAELYVKAYVNAFEVNAEEVENLEYQQIEAWDSVGHMTLIDEIESAFDIMMETDDIVDLSSFAKGKEILSSNYGIEF